MKAPDSPYTDFPPLDTQLPARPADGQENSVASSPKSKPKISGESSVPIGDAVRKPLAVLSSDIMSVADNVGLNATPNQMAGADDPFDIDAADELANDIALSDNDTETLADGLANDIALSDDDMEELDGELLDDVVLSD